MTIRTIYYVEVVVDSATGLRIAEHSMEDEVQRDFVDATDDRRVAGMVSTKYGLNLWAEAASHAAAVSIEKRLLRLAAKWNAWAQLPREE